MSRLTGLFAGVAVCVIAVGAQAQVGQVNTGNALDANPSTIGGKVNARVQPRPTYNTGELLMTGQLGGGRSFRGDVGYRASNQFGGRLGSDSLYNFHRESVGLDQITRYGGLPTTQQPAYIYSPRSVTSLGSISQNATVHADRIMGAGPSYGRSGYVVTSPRYNPATMTGPSTISAQPYSSIDALQRPPAELLNMRYQDLQAGGRLPYSAVPAETTEPNLAKVIGTGQEARVAEPVVSERVEPSPVLDPRTGQPIARPTDATGQPEQPEPPRAELPAGDDLYSDLLRRADELLGPPQPAKAPADQDQPTEPDKQPSKPEPILKEPDAQPMPAVEGDENEPPTPTIVLPPVDKAQLLNLNVTYNSFASKRPSQANVAIRRAEAMMRAGQFFSALGRLAEAERFDPDNPLIWLRACHAHVGAGQFQDAADALGQVIAVFPSALSVKTDLSTLMGGQKGFGGRLGELGLLAGQTGSLRLGALLCYLQFTSGLGRGAQASAHRLRSMNDAGPKDPGVAALVHLVLQGPPTPRPAGGN